MAFHLYLVIGLECNGPTYHVVSSQHGVYHLCDCLAVYHVACPNTTYSIVGDPPHINICVCGLNCTRAHTYALTASSKYEQCEPQYHKPMLLS